MKVEALAWIPLIIIFSTVAFRFFYLILFEIESPFDKLIKSSGRLLSPEFTSKVLLTMLLLILEKVVLISGLSTPPYLIKFPLFGMRRLV